MADGDSSVDGAQVPTMLCILETECMHITCMLKFLEAK